MPFNLLQRLRSVNRKLIIISGLIYLSLVFLFHGRLEFEQQLDNRFKTVFFKRNPVHLYLKKNTSATSISHSLHSSLKNKMELHVRNISTKPHVHIQANTPNFTLPYKNINITHAPNYKNCYQSSSNVGNNTFHRISDGIFIYSAYLDDRHSVPFVRVMTIIAQRKYKLRYFCHFPGNFWTDGLVYQMCENHNKHFGGYIISCPLPSSKPDQQKLFCSVSISLKKNGDTNHSSFIPITKIRTNSQPFSYGICIPPLFGNISQEHLVEYIELSKLLGVQHLYFYSFRLSDAATHVLEYYEKQNTVTIIPWKLPVEIHDNTIWYNGQLIAHNDCLYRSMSQVKMVAFNDLDEFIIPHNGSTWTDFVNRLSGENVCGFSFWSAFFDPSTGRPHPSGLFTMSQTGRSAKFSQVRTKVLVEPLKIFEVGIHHVSKPNEEHYKMLRVDTNVAFLHHYRKCVSNYGMKCDKFIPDRAIYRYFDDLKTAFDSQLKIIRQINSTA
ncbi:Hypothetical predicted protein [Octopus vulgaris]|uniref:Glycosyltransferase family 92 protein n=1 Tax=Octopus vulgaris TaxID=6645 RepID=A0AA36AJU7_OCTVU|nr:Hypothetical predicted protein [Octopus vulgaris]